MIYDVFVISLIGYAMIVSAQICLHIAHVYAYELLSFNVVNHRLRIYCSTYMVRLRWHTSKTGVLLKLYRPYLAQWYVPLSTVDMRKK